MSHSHSTGILLQVRFFGPLILYVSILRKFVITGLNFLPIANFNSELREGQKIRYTYISFLHKSAFLRALKSKKALRSNIFKCQIINFKRHLGAWIFLKAPTATIKDIKIYQICSILFTSFALKFTIHRLLNFIKDCQNL